MKMIFSLLLTALMFVSWVKPIFAIVDPLAVPNNKFGIHLIQGTVDESSPAAQLVNTNGDWGYVTVLIESKDRKEDKWNEFFNDLRRRHLIPIVRIATQPEGNFWKRPYDGEEQAWADFLDKLNWPTKNRYVTIYNEPNHGHEWAGVADPKTYAENLDKTITALKNKSPDFFVMNAGFDASTPQQPPLYLEQLYFMREMEKAVPGIFKKLDGWASHSYPNPGFIGSPQGTGKGSVRTYLWEQEVLKNEFGVTKRLPIFITETGWKHAEGMIPNSSLPSAQTVSEYYEYAFSNVWNQSNIVAITPFLLDYQEAPFDHFSFKKLNSEKSESSYYPQYEILKNINKTKGQPTQEATATLIKGEVFKTLVAGEVYQISLTFKNTGQSIWNDVEKLELVPIQGGNNLGIETLEIPAGHKVEPGQEYTFTFKIKAPQQGNFKTVLNLYQGKKAFDNPPFEFESEVKSPVVILIRSSLKWKNNSSGDYTLSVSGAAGKSSQNITLNEKGVSSEIEARYLLPDYDFDFTLSKPFYKEKTIRQRVQPGINVLDFGTLEPGILSTLLKPKELWQLLPFSN